MVAIQKIINAPESFREPTTDEKIVRLLHVLIERGVQIHPDEIDSIMERLNEPIFSPYS